MPLILNFPGGGGYQVSGTAIGAEPALNLIPGSNVTITGSDNTANKRVDITVNSTSTGGGGGNTISSTVFGSEPGSPATGDLDLYTNGPTIARWNGTAWSPSGPIFKFTTPPNVATLTWLNQSLATASNTGGVLVMRSIEGDGNDSLHFLSTAAPATPWTFTISCGMLVGPGTASTVAPNFCGGGIGLRDSISGKVTLIRACLNQQALRVDTYTNITTFFLNAFVFTPNSVPTDLIFYRVTDDGVNLTYQYSYNGINFTTLFSGSRTVFLTNGPNQVGIIIGGDSLSEQFFNVYSWTGI